MEELLIKTAELAEENRILREMVSSLVAENAELKARLNKNSKNSNKPPSSDGHGKGTVKNSRISSGKQSGGQNGHIGRTKEKTTSPDVVIELKPQSACECGGEVEIRTDKFTVHQVTDIEPVKVVTVEYRAKDGVCASCGKVHKASFPTGAEGVVSYGKNLKSVLCYLTNYQLLPLKRSTELMNDLFGLRVSQGTIVSAIQECCEKLDPSEELIPFTL
jgi:transposase